MSLLVLLSVKPRNSHYNKLQDSDVRHILKWIVTNHDVESLDFTSMVNPSNFFSWIKVMHGIKQGYSVKKKEKKKKSRKILLQKLTGSKCVLQLRGQEYLFARLCTNEGEEENGICKAKVRP